MLLFARIELPVGENFWFKLHAGEWPAWMTRPYSKDIRERALARADAGETVRSIAEALQMTLRASSLSMRPGSKPIWRGWGPRGQRLEASAPFGHWKTMTFIAALRHDRISAPWLIDGPINGELFTLHVEKELAPTLSKGELVVLDNLGSHKGKPARNAIRAKGAHLLFLPPYSPDLNPIEQVFAKLKHLMRAARAARRRGYVAKGRPTPRSLLHRRVRQNRMAWFRPGVLELCGYIKADSTNT
jgi:transposase